MEPTFIIHHFLAIHKLTKTIKTIKKKKIYYIRLIRKLVISLKETCASHAHLTLWRLARGRGRVRKVTHFRNIFEFDLVVGKRRAHVTSLPVADLSQAQACGRLRKTVALQHGATKATERETSLETLT